MKKNLLILIPVVLLITITIILFPYHTSKQIVQKRSDPKTEMVKKIAKMIKEQPRFKRQDSAPVKPAPVIEEKEKEPQDRVMATSLREEIKRYEEEGKKDIRMVLNTTDNNEEVSNSVINVGGKVIRKRPGFIAVEVPTDKAEQLIMGNSLIGFARLPFKFFPTGMVTEGVNLTGANIFHDTIYRGAGVKVAVLDGGFKNLTAAISAGELPANVITHDFSGSGLQTESMHGTACAEIIHDMAPDAELHLLKMGDEIDSYEVIDYCIDNNIDIVNLSMGTFGSGPGDGTGPVDEAFDELRDAGILVVAAAGNYGNTSYEEDGKVITMGSHWEGTFNDNNNDTYHEFKDGYPDSYYNVLWAYPTEDDDGNPSTSEVSILLRWNKRSVTNVDYNLELYTYNFDTQTIGTIPVETSTTLQTGTQSPVEYISLDIPDDAEEGLFYAIKVNRLNTEIQTGIKMEIYLGGTSEFVPNILTFDINSNNWSAFSTSTSSISEPADAESVMAVGAIDYINWQTGPQEEYSSQGPTNAWNGRRARTKPDIMGPDRVTTYTYGDTSFPGTSAAAPHVAGLAALTLSMNQSMSSNELQEFLEANAVDMGALGMDNIYGRGRLKSVLPGLSLTKSFQKISELYGNLSADLSMYDGFGSGVVNIGDIDGNGFSDLAVGASGDDNDGALYILLMASDGTVELNVKISDTAGTFNGVTNVGDNFGTVITSIGDLDGDGIPELAVGAPDEAVGNTHGTIWILFLNANGTVRKFKRINTEEGNFTGNWYNLDTFGSSIAGIGDLNNDGVPDMVMGNASDDELGTNYGAIWILFLDSNGEVLSEQKINPNHGNFQGVLKSNDLFGWAVAGIGDMNGDNMPDIAVGAPGRGDEGTVWILFMNQDGTVKTHQKINSTNGNFTGDIEQGDNFGNSIASMGDLDGDGISDLAVGAPWDDDCSPDRRGAFWLLFMHPDGTVKDHKKISCSDRILLNMSNPASYTHYLGGPITSIGDFNNDGINDIVFGTPADNDGNWGQGAIWVLFLNPLHNETDYDGMPDTWEIKYGFNPNLNDSSTDSDNDGLINLYEYKIGTHPREADTDNDSIRDGDEDANHNGILDSGETNPNEADTDYDGMPDGWEVQYGLNPLVNDAEGDLDNDRFSNIKEYQKGSLPNDRKSRPKTGMPWLPLLLED